MYYQFATTKKINLQKNIKKVQSIKIKKPNSKSNKKKKIIGWTAFGVGSVILVGAVAGISYYLLTPTDNSWSGANEYISSRSLSLQFLYDTSGDGTTSSSSLAGGGTGWILNKDLNDEVYYVATNLHVAALLTYQNKEVYNYESGTSTLYGTIIQSLVGYVNPTSDSSSSDMNMITVPTPTVVYTPYNDSNWTSTYPNTITGLYTYRNSAGNITTGSTYSYNTTADFAILRYDFTNLITASASISSTDSSSSAILPNTTDDVNNFSNWLNNYKQNPTQFLNSAIQDVSDWQNLKYSMGGFPASHGTSASYGGNSNYVNASWTSYANINSTNNMISESTYGNAGYDYTVSANQTRSRYKSPIVYVDDATTSSDGFYSLGYINIAYNMFLESSSASGASGSLIVTYYNNQPYVVGIYWGEITFASTSDSSVTYTYGIGDIFNVSSNGTYNNTTMSGYDLISWAYSYLSSSNSLYYNNVTNSAN